MTKKEMILTIARTKHKALDKYNDSCLIFGRDNEISHYNSVYFVALFDLCNALGIDSHAVLAEMHEF